jgi:hypothetical protein
VEEKKTLECFCNGYAIEPSFTKFSSSQCDANCIQCNCDIEASLKGYRVKEYINGEVIYEKRSQSWDLSKFSVTYSTSSTVPTLGISGGTPTIGAWGSVVIKALRY